jgi:TatD DNase family protein
MQITDTHAHLYMNEFEEDLNEVIERAKKKGVYRILLPNVDEDSFDPMIKICSRNPEIFRPMIGLHPCYVKKDYEQQLIKLLNRKQEYDFIAVGEIGIDLYWDTTLKEEQIKAFEIQTRWALENKLPIVIHSRESLDLIIELLQFWNLDGLKGVFHCFTGDVDQARKIIDLGFKLGIGGVVTYKKSLLDLVIREIGTKDLVLETDAPYLSPVPFRGKRNESSYMVEILNKISFISGKSAEQIARDTEESCLEIFGI